MLARDTQSKVYIAQGIREALALIQRVKQESSTGFLLLDQIAMEILDSPRENSTTPTNNLANSPGIKGTSALHSQHEECHPGPNLEAGR